MNKENIVDKIDADELINNIRFNYNENFVMYLKELWNVSFLIIKINFFFNKKLGFIFKKR
jgi:hypothetical protein